MVTKKRCFKFLREKDLSLRLFLIYQLRESVPKFLHIKKLSTILVRYLWE